MKFEPSFLFDTEDFNDNIGETFGKYEGKDYEVFFNMYKGKKVMTLSVFQKPPKIPEDVYYLSLSITENPITFPKIPKSVKGLLIDGCPLKKIPKIPDSIVDFNISLHSSDACLLKNTGDLSYLTNLKKFSVTYRNKSLEIGKLPESLRTFSAVGINGRIRLPEQFPKNLFFIHLHGFDKLTVPDLTYLKKLRILSVFYCQILAYFGEPPVDSCELRFRSIKEGSVSFPSSYRKDGRKVSFTNDK